MAERKKIRFISPEPRLSIRLRERRPAIIPEDLYNYGVDWVEDVGMIMRSRSYMAGTIASYIGYGAMLLLFSFLPGLKRFTFVSEVLGVK